MKFGYEHEEAVSPVIGVILMVAITVILAATVAVFVLGQTDQMEANKVVAVKAASTDTDVTLTIAGGANVNELTALKFIWDGAAYTGTVIANGKKVDSGFDATKGILSSTATNGTGTGTKVFENGVFHAGDKIKITKATGNKAFVVTAYYADGTDGVIYEKTFA